MADRVTAPHREPELGIGMVAAIFLPLAGGYFLSFLYRSINAMIAPNLVVEFDLSPSQLGFVTAIYFLSFGLSQLPLGVLLDHFGPAKVQSTLLAVAAAGAVLFSIGESVAMLTLGRGLIGVATAVGAPGCHLLVVIPIRVKQLNESHTSFRQSSCQNAIRRVGTRPTRFRTIKPER